MQTRKLFYEDSHLSSFSARVLSCRPGKQDYEIILDATAFYPEGGGQAGDTGFLNGVRVTDTREREGEILHICREPLALGTQVTGNIDYAPRFYRMQQHSGEHIVSGIVSRRYGYHNTGFHMGTESTTIDFDGVIPAQDLPEIEAEANRAVWENIPLRCWYPSEKELPDVFYRSKRTLEYPVRIVQIPGYDSCACCGTHVAATGEIGLIKLLSVVGFRGGTRMEMACGELALAILNHAFAQNRQVSQAFSAHIRETGAAARRMNELLSSQKFRITALERELFSRIAAGCAGCGDMLLFRDDLDNPGVRELADATAESCGGTAAVFSGNDETGFAFCLATRQGDLRQLCKEMTAALGGRGGGKPGFQQGSVAAGKKRIEAFFSGFKTL